jgi:hypothetical protein
VGRVSPTTARAEALKARLMNKPVENPAPPRIATTSARQEQYSQLKSYAPAPTQAPAPTAQPMSDVAPPPTGLNPDAPAVEAPSQGLDLSQIANTEGVKEEPTEATSQPLSPQFVALAKKEQAIRRKLQELKSQQDAFEREKANYVAKESLKENPLTALNELGLSYDKLTELQLSQQNPDPNHQTLEQIEKLKTQLEERLTSFDKKLEDRDKQAYDAAVNQIRKDVQLLVDSDPSFETIKASGEIDSVVELMERVFQKEGTVLSVEEAAKLVEDALTERELARVQNLLKVSKLKQRLGVAEQTQPQKEVQQQPQPTLSNTQAVNRPLTARERAIMRVQEINAAKAKK